MIFQISPSRLREQMVRHQSETSPISVHRCCQKMDQGSEGTGAPAVGALHPRWQTRLLAGGDDHGGRVLRIDGPDAREAGPLQPLAVLGQRKNIPFLSVKDHAKGEE